MGTTTDKDGFYSMKPIPAGRYELVISMIGYKMERQDLIIYDNDRIALDFRLKPEPIQMAEITVTYKKDKKWQKDYKLFKQTLIVSLITIISISLFTNNSSSNIHGLNSIFYLSLKFIYNFYISI